MIYVIGFIALGCLVLSDDVANAVRNFGVAMALVALICLIF